MEKDVVSYLDTEKELLANALVNKEAFGTIYEYYYPRLYNYVRVRVGDASVADDLVSLIFEKVVRKLSYYDKKKGQFSTWLFTIANNMVIDYFRRESNRFEHPIDACQLKAVSTDEEGPLERVLKQDMKQCLLEAVSCLDTRGQNLVALKFWGGLTNRQIAELLEMNEKTVGVVLFRAVKRLKQILMDNKCFESGDAGD